MKRNPRPVTVIALTLVIGVIVGYALAQRERAHAEAGETARERESVESFLDAPTAVHDADDVLDMFAEDDDATLS